MTKNKRLMEAIRIVAVVVVALAIGFVITPLATIGF